MRISSSRRSGVTTVECAIVFPVTFLLIVGLVVGAAGMFRYQQMSHLARTAARYASVHGTQWQKDTGQPAASDPHFRRRR